MSEQEETAHRITAKGLDFIDAGYDRMYERALLLEKENDELRFVAECNNAVIEFLLEQAPELAELVSKEIVGEEG